MGLETVSFINDLVSSNPTSGDPKSEGDDHIRNIKAALKAVFPNMGGIAFRQLTKSAGYTVVAADHLTIINCTAALTLSLTAAATLAAGHMFMVYASGGEVVLDPNSTELINGTATKTLLKGTFAVVSCTGTAFIALTHEPITARGSIAMHATTMDLFGQPNTIVDGTSSAVTMTDIADAPYVGMTRKLYPPTGTIITNGATFAVEGGANYTTEAGDALVFESITTSTFKVWVDRASGTAVVGSGSGSITSSGYTTSTDRLLGRDTAGSGAIEELTVGTGLTLAGGELSVTAGSGLRLIKYTEITATDATWAKQADTTAIEVLCVGGGGGGASVSSGTENASTGGGAGEQVRGFLDTGLTSTYVATIGSGGSAGANGNTTSFTTSTPTTIASAQGGLGGKVLGVFTNALSGSNGESGVKRGGAGGSSFGGAAAANSGAGGGGSADVGSGGTGGAGGSGIIYVWEYAE